MTPKEKAFELMDKMACGDSYRNIGAGWSAKLPNNKFYLRCAWIAVDEILSSRKDDSQFDDTLWAGGSDMYTMHPMYLKYWEQVKQELEKI